MGNQTGKDQADSFPIRPQQEKLEQLYEKLCDDEKVISLSLFEDHFQAPAYRVTKNLFNQFFIDLVNAAYETKFLFVDRCHHILQSTDRTHIDQIHFFFDLVANNTAEITCDDLKKIVHIYYTFGIHQVSIEDDMETCPQIDTSDKLICCIAETMLNGRKQINREEVVKWIQVNCPNMSNGLHAWLEYKLIGTLHKTKFDILPQPSECSSSNLLLSSSYLWFLCSTLPSCYTYMENKFKSDTEMHEPADEALAWHVIDSLVNMDMNDAKFTWNLLYNSNQHGLSLNRFKHKVMEYKSPTVTLIELSSGSILVLALDEKWIDSPEKYGGHYCQLIELSPKVSIIEANSKLVYLKECGRSVPTGLLLGSETTPKVKISTDLNTAQLYYKNELDQQVERIEVWGCGGVEAMKSQDDIKKWEQEETEKRKKVKLPGQWDADKSLLEMGGVRVNHSERGDV